MRRVNEKLAIGDADDAELYGERFDIVISLARAENTTNHHGLIHRPLVDGENDFEDFADAVDVVRESLRSSESVLVHCQVGASRSVTVLATALAAENDSYFDDELYEVRMPGVYPSPELLDLAKEYLEKMEAEES